MIQTTEELYDIIHNILQHNIEVEISKGFEHACKALQNRVLIQDLQKSFTSKQSCKGEARIFLSAYLMARYPDSTLSMEKSVLESQLHRKSMHLTMFTHKLLLYLDSTKDAKRETAYSLQNLHEFNHHFQGFYTIFQDWKKKDRQSLMENFGRIQSQLDKHAQVTQADPSLDDDDRTSIQHSIARTQQKLDTLQKSISGTHPNKSTHQADQEAIERGSTYGVLESGVLFQNIHDTMKKAFWDIFQEDLLKKPLDMKPYISLVEEIQAKFDYILPQKNHASLRDYIHTGINLSNIRHKIEKGLYTVEDIYHLVVFCLERLENLDARDKSPSHTARMQETHVMFERVSHTRLLDMDTETAVCIRDMLQDLLQRLDHLEGYKFVFQEYLQDKNKS